MNRFNKLIFKKWVLVIIFGGVVMASTTLANSSESNVSNEQEGKFQNSEINYQSSLSSVWKIAKAYWQTDNTREYPPVH